MHAREGRRSVAQRLDGDRAAARHLHQLHRDAVPVSRATSINLLDTPGHRDFSEDTYRVLAAVDAVVMVLDAAKGIESPDAEAVPGVPGAQPAGDHVPQQVRPARAASRSSCSTRSRQQIELRPTPVTWPVGSGDEFRGVVDRRTGQYTAFTRTARGASARRSRTTSISTDGVAPRAAAAWQHGVDELGLLDAVGADVDLPSFLAGESTPVFVGSALTNFGVRKLLDAVVDLAPAPSPRRRRRRRAAPARRAVLRVRVQGAGQHGPVAPRPHRVRPHLLGHVRARA